VTNALGEWYRVTVPLDGQMFMFLVKGNEVARLLAKFPGYRVVEAFATK